MASYAQLAKKLQGAINRKTGEKGVKLLINTQQWFSKDKNRPVTVYVVRQTVQTIGDKKTTIELYRTYSHVQLVLWLRDYWYELNGWELPTDSTLWEGVKNKPYEAETINET